MCSNIKILNNNLQFVHCLKIDNCHNQHVKCCVLLQFRNINLIKHCTIEKICFWNVPYHTIILFRQSFQSETVHIL